MALNIYLRSLGVFYFIGFIFHVMDLQGLRLLFSEMNLIWKLWIIFLTVADLMVAIGLWCLSFWGVVGFHFVTLFIYYFLKIKNRVS